MKRYPLPMPFGWFQVCWPDEVGVGEVLPLYYFGRHLVAWRDEEGTAHVWDAFCPHLGSHLGYGGKVEGCTIACPLHSWVFDAEGNNVDVPYSDRINKKAHIRTYPTVERNGAVLAWYHPTDAPPQWEVPEIPELNGDPEFGKVYRKHYKIKTHWQEVAETTADAAHIQQHLVRYEKELNGGKAGPIRMPEVDEYRTEFPNAHMRISQKFPTPRGMLEGRIDTDSYGPGLAATWFRGLIDTLALGCAVPVDEESCELRLSFAVRDLGDEATTNSVAEAFVEGIHEQTVEDLPLWEHKAYVPHPALSNADGPIMKFRKWAAQFYAEGVEDDQDLYVPSPS